MKSGLEHYLATVLPFAGRHADAPANLQDMVPRTAMSQANARELKAALGHVLVSPSPSNWQYDNADDHDRWRKRCPMTFPVQVHPSCSWRALANHGTYWMAQVAAFSSAFQVVTFDHGGVGASEGQPPYKVEQWAADTLRLIDHLGLDRVHLVGHSTGGATWARLELSELIAEEIAHVRLVKLDHGGHHFPRTQVEAYNALLLEFFRAHAKRDAPGAG